MDEVLEETPAPFGNESNAPWAPQVHSSWVVSVCFWSTLLLAAVLYGAVALSPKFAVWSRVRHDFRTNANHMVSLENDIEYLERVDAALKTDDDMANQIAGLHRPAAGQTEENILVSGSLMFGRENVAVPQPQKFVPSRFDQLVVAVASQSSLRTFLLVSSAALVIFAFTFLNDAGEGLVTESGRMLKSAAMLPIKRYLSANEQSGNKQGEQEDDSADSFGEPESEKDT